MKKKILEFKNRDNLFRHMCQLFELQIHQFEYDGLPDTLPPEFLEFYLLINGTVAIGHADKSDDIYCAVGSYTGNYNGYLPTEYAAAVLDIGEIRGFWYGENKNIVVGKNNNFRAPEFDIPFTANVLTQVDISEDCNVIFSRFVKLPFADNDKEKTQLESAIKSIAKGDYTAVFSRDTANSFEKFIEGGIEKDKFLELVDVDKINGLQYLNQYRDNIVKRFLSRRGYMVQTTSKLAQQTNTEMHGADSYSFLYPLNQLKARQQMCEELNTVFGLNCSVKFNPILEKVYKDFMTEPEKEENVSRETGDNETAETVSRETTETEETEVENNDPNS